MLVKDKVRNREVLRLVHLRARAVPVLVQIIRDRGLEPQREVALLF